MYDLSGPGGFYWGPIGPQLTRVLRECRASEERRQTFAQFMRSRVVTRRI